MYKQSSQQACADHCEAQYNCVGFEFIFTKAFCYLKFDAKNSGRNFKNSNIGDLYIRKGGARKGLQSIKK